MTILALDTATEVCSVALYGDTLIAERYVDAAPQASRIVLAMLDELMRAEQAEWADIDLLVFGQGPGSFTGVRVATGLIQGLAFGHQLPVMGISTLAAIAWTATQQDAATARPVLSVMDARMQELYWGCFRRDADGGLSALGEEAVSPCADIQLPEQGDWLAAGNADSVYAEVLGAALLPSRLEWVGEVTPRASVMAELALYQLRKGVKGRPADQVRPVYLRHQVVQQGRKA